MVGLRTDIWKMDSSELAEASDVMQDQRWQEQKKQKERLTQH
jgi:hypothetical protein